MDEIVLQEAVETLLSRTKKIQEKEMISLIPKKVKAISQSTFPKIEVIRKDVSEYPVSNPVGRFLIVTDRDKEEYAEPAVGFENLDEIVKAILNVEDERCITVKY